MMTTRAEVPKELSSLEKVQAELAGVASRTDVERARDLIRLRRLLSEQIGRMGQVAERYFLAASDSGVTVQFRDHFSKMRSRAANRAFVAWMRRALA